MVDTNLINVIIWPFAAAVTAWTIAQMPMSTANQTLITKRNIFLLLGINGLVSLGAALRGGPIIADGALTAQAGTLSYGLSFLIAAVAGFLFETRKKDDER